MKKIIVSMYIIISISYISCNKKEDLANDKFIIKNKFKNWQNTKIKSGEYLDSISCNLDFFENKKNKISLDSISNIGFPEYSEIEYYFGDINNDKITDGIVTFNIKPCDGAWALNNLQKKIIILSLKKSKYKIIENYFQPIADSLGGGEIYIDSISDNLILAVYYEHLDDDPNCCPSFKKHIKIDINSKITY